MKVTDIHTAVFAFIQPFHRKGKWPELSSALDRIHKDDSSGEDLALIMEALDLWHSRWIDVKARLRDNTRLATATETNGWSGGEPLYDAMEEYTARHIHEHLAHISWYARENSLRGPLHPESVALVDEAIAALRSIANLCGFDDQLTDLV